MGVPDILPAVLPAILPVAASYLIGSIPAGWLVCRLATGADLRALGSGNPGATNLYRVMGLRVAAPVALFDMAKGLGPVLWAGPEREWLAAALGLVAVIGHMFPIWLGFRGGKGVATGAGAVLGLAPMAVGAALALWAALVWLRRIVSLASILSALALPALVWALYPERPVTLGLSVAMALVIVAAHRSNFQRLLAGTEPRVGRIGAGGSARADGSA